MKSVSSQNSSVVMVSSCNIDLFPLITLHKNMRQSIKITYNKHFSSHYFVILEFHRFVLCHISPQLAYVKIKAIKSIRTLFFWYVQQINPYFSCANEVLQETFQRCVLYFKCPHILFFGTRVSNDQACSIILSIFYDYRLSIFKKNVLFIPESCAGQ